MKAPPMVPTEDELAWLYFGAGDGAVLKRSDAIEIARELAKDVRGRSYAAGFAAALAILENPDSALIARVADAISAVVGRGLYLTPAEIALRAAAAGLADSADDTK